MPSERAYLISQLQLYAKRIYNTHTRFLACGDGRAMIRYNSEMRKLSKRFSGKFNLVRQVADFYMISTGKKHYKAMNHYQLRDTLASFIYLNERSDIRSLRNYRKILRISDQKVLETAREYTDIENLSVEESKVIYTYIDALRNSGIDIKPSSQFYDMALDMITHTNPTERLAELIASYKEHHNRSVELSKSTEPNADVENKRPKRKPRGNPKNNTLQHRPTHDIL